MPPWSTRRWAQPSEVLSRAKALLPSQLTLTYLHPGEPGRLIVTAQVRKRGDSLVVCEADVEQDGKSLVHALATFAL